MVEPQDRNNYCVESLRVFNFDFWFVAPGPVSASRGLSTGTAAATAPSAFAAPKELGGRGGGRGSPGWGPRLCESLQAWPSLSSTFPCPRVPKHSCPQGSPATRSIWWRWDVPWHLWPQLTVSGATDFLREATATLSPPTPFLSSRRVDEGRGKLVVLVFAGAWGLFIVFFC